MSGFPGNQNQPERGAKPAGGENPSAERSRARDSDRFLDETFEHLAGQSEELQGQPRAVNVADGEGVNRGAVANGAVDANVPGAANVPQAEVGQSAVAKTKKRRRRQPEPRRFGVPIGQGKKVPALKRPAVPIDEILRKRGRQGGYSAGPGGPSVSLRTDPYNNLHMAAPGADDALRPAGNSGAEYAQTDTRPAPGRSADPGTSERRPGPESLDFLDDLDDTLLPRAFADKENDDVFDVTRPGSPEHDASERASGTRRLLQACAIVFLGLVSVFTLFDYLGRTADSNLQDESSSASSRLSSNSQNGRMAVTDTSSASEVSNVGTELPDSGLNSTPVAEQQSAFIDAPSTEISPLRIQRDQLVTELSQLIKAGQLDQAEARLEDMDLVIYGYGQPEFDALADDITALRNGAELANTSLAVDQTDTEQRSSADTDAVSESSELESGTSSQINPTDADPATTQAPADSESSALVTASDREAALQFAEETRRLRLEARQIAEETLRVRELAEQEKLQKQTELARVLEQQRLAEEERTERAQQQRLEAQAAREQEEVRLQEVREQLKLEQQRAEEALREIEQRRIAEEVRLQAEQRKLADARQLVEEQLLASQLEAERLAEQQRLQQQALAQQQAAARREAQREAEVQRQAEAEAEAERLAAEQAAQIEAEQAAEEAAEEAARREAARLAEQQRQAEAEAQRLAAEQAAEEAALREAARLAELQRQEEAEAQRLAAEQAAEEAARREAARLAEQQRQAEAEAQRLAAEQAAEEAARREAARLAELQRQAEAEAQRLAAEQAAEQAAQQEAQRQAELSAAAETNEQALAEQRQLLELRRRQEVERLAEEQRRKVELAARLAEQRRQEDAQRRVAEAAREAEIRRQEQSALAIQAQRERQQALERQREQLRANAAEQQRRATQAAVSSGSTVSPDTDAVAETPVESASNAGSITDQDLADVYRKFQELQQAIESKDMGRMVELTESSTKIGLFLQLFQNFEELDISLANISSQASNATVRGKLIVNSVTRNGVRTPPPSAYPTETRISSSKDASGNWSRILW